MAPGDDAEGEVEHGQVAGRLLLPADQDAAKAVQPGMRALDHPPPRFGAGLTLGRTLLAAGPQVEGEAELGGERRHLGVVEPLVEAEPLRRVGAGRSTGTASMVSRISLWSFRLAPATARPSGTPRPSVSRLRLVPDLPLSVGVGPVFPPAERRLAHRPAERQPIPIDPDQVVVGQEAPAPELVEHAGLGPLQEAAVRRGG